MNDKPKMMICENAERCLDENCKHKKEHEKSISCDMPCWFKDSGCIEVKDQEKTMTILENLEELKIKTQYDPLFSVINIGIDKAIQIVKESQHKKWTYSMISEWYDKEESKSLFQGMIDAAIRFAKENGIYEEPPKRYKWTEGTVTTNKEYTEEEMKKEFTCFEDWRKVEEEE